MKHTEARHGKAVTTLSRDLNLFQLTMMGVGMMIGAGAVLGMGFSVRISGPGGTLLAFSLNGLIALCTAMAYAEMSSALPRAGSIYNFARIAFGRGIGFTAGWISWFASSVAGSLYAVVFSEYTLHYLDLLGLLNWLPIPIFLRERGLALILALVFIYINYRGVSTTGKLESFLTLGQTLTLGFIGVVGIVVVVSDPSRVLNFQPFIPHGTSAILVCMGFEYIAFEGYEVIAQAGDEVVNPRRNLPKAILYSVLIVTLTYVVVAFALITGIKDVNMPAWEWLGSFGEKGFGAAMEQIIPYGNLVAVLTVIFASTSALNATIYSAARASYALGRDHMLPPAIGSISSKRKTPHIAILCTAIIVAAFIFLPILDIASGASIMFLFMFLLANLSVIRMRTRMADELHYGYLMPFFPFIPAVAIVMQILLAIFIIDVSYLAWIIAPSWVGLGLLIYFTYSRTRALPIREEILTIESAYAPERERYLVLVPVEDIEDVLGIVRQVMVLTKAENGAVELLHMVTIPDQVPLSDAARYTLPGKEAIAEATLYLSSRFSISSSLRYCRNTARGILSAAREREANLIVLSWTGLTRQRGFIFGTTIDPVLEKAPCDVVVFRNMENQPFKRVLVPLSGGHNSSLALEVAGLMVDKNDGRIVCLHVKQPGKTQFHLNEYLDSVCSESTISRDILQSKVIASSNPARTILQETSDFDLVVIGASREPYWRRAVMGTIPEKVAKRCQKPLIMVKAKGAIRAFLSGWL
jgi:APA family basic amino acid/polyamine antiporter